MAFLVYRRRAGEGKDVLEATGDYFSLAGYNLIYSAWEKKGKPIRRGWHVTADELIQIYSDGKESYESLRFIIDYDPKSKRRIALIELLEVYLYTWDGSAADVPGWTAMMLRMRDVLEKWTNRPLSPEKRTKGIALFEVSRYGNESVEFLYLKGKDEKWNWGRNGSTNAVFLHGGARKYFRQYF